MIGKIGAKRAGRWRNWGRNQQCAPVAVDEPQSLLEVVEAVDAAAQTGQTVKVVASGHSFSDVACTNGRMLRLGALDRVVAIDRDAMTATVEAGIPLWRLNEELGRRGLALSNLGDIDRQTIAGATSTGTHGTGVRYGSIAAAIVGLELVTGSGEVVRCSAAEEPEIFTCARVGLGALGVVTQVTLQCEPLFKLRAVEEPKPWAEFLAEWDGIVDANEHVDCYWFPHTDTCTVKMSNRTDDPIRTRRGYKKWKSEIYYGNVRHGLSAARGRRQPEQIPELARGLVAGFHRGERVDLELQRLLQHSPRAVRGDGVRDPACRHGSGAPLDPGAHRTRGPARRLPDRDPRDRRGRHPAQHGRGSRDRATSRCTCRRARPYEPYFRGVEAIMDGLGGRPHWGKMHFQTERRPGAALPGVGAVPRGAPASSIRTAGSAMRTPIGCSGLP